KRLMKAPTKTAAVLLTALLACSAATAADTDDSATEAADAATARDELRLDATNVTGNRELPRVMVIVPWKRSVPAELAGRPLNSLMDEVLTPIDREVFVRRLKFYDGLQAASDAESAP
ncbi:MAG: hypothetical protein AAGD86_01605, partial [Pseudomonadota bacterium]